MRRRRSTLCSSRSCCRKAPRSYSCSASDRTDLTTATSFPSAATTSTFLVVASRWRPPLRSGRPRLSSRRTSGLDAPDSRSAAEFLNSPHRCEARRMIQESLELCENILLTGPARLPTRYGPFRIYAFQCPFTGDDHVALVKGQIARREDVLVRLHSECVTGDVFGSERCDCGAQLDAALKRLGKAPRGALLYLAQEGRGIGIANKVAAYHLQDHGLDTVDANRILGFPADLRDYKCAACMLRVLGVASVRLMTNNPAKIEELEGYGVRVSKRIPLEAPVTAANVRYLRSKKERLRHLLTTPTVRAVRSTRRSRPR